GARQALDLILDHLTQTAEAFDGGIRWHTPPEDLPTWQRELAPEGYYNLGAAHGIPALITLLARCCQAGIRRPELQPIVDRAGTWVLAQRQPQGFPSWVTPDAKRQEAQRLAWCYGDPGVAGTVLAASLAIGQATWQEQALAIARHAAARDLEHAGLQDAGVCHGTAGLAHIFNRFYQATGCQTVGHAARTWLAETLERRRPGQGLGGYQAWSLPPGQSGTEALTWIDQPGLLTGSAGIGLCLLAAVTPQEPAWDAALGLSAPA
ncbi:MAG: lanthionine synthetase C family protein, partial [Acidobacteriota bacterium]